MKAFLSALVQIVTIGSFVFVGATAATAEESSLQAEIDKAMSEHPGGTQVSDNAVVWNQGDVVMVFPGPGQYKAPKGLGSGVDRKALRKIGAEYLADPSPADVEGCPSGITTKDYYCFYYNANWGGTRKQFADTCTSTAQEWGFEDQTSSWVATDIDKTIVAYANRGRTQYLWSMPENSKVSYVGDANNDKMRAWTCRE